MTRYLLHVMYSSLPPDQSDLFTRSLLLGWLAAGLGGEC
jgi:hypothetical protein